MSDQIAGTLIDNFLIDGAIFIDNSTLEAYNNCPRAFEYRSIRKRVTAAPQSALTFGGAIHKALEHRYKNDKDLKGGEATESAMLSAFATALEGRPISEDDYRNYDYGCGMLRQYNTCYPVEEFEIATTPMGELMVELPFAIALGTVHYGTAGLVQIPVIYTGRLDLGIYLPDGSFWVMDHKTSSIVGDSFYAQQAMSAQQEGYNYACWRTTGKRPEGFIINMLASRKPSKTGKGIEFNRQRVYLSEERLEEWKQNTLVLVQEMMDYFSLSHFPMRKAHCVGKYGRCQFYDVCSLPQGQRHLLLESNLFTTNTWSPLNAPSQSTE